MKRIRNAAEAFEWQTGETINDLDHGQVFVKRILGSGRPETAVVLFSVPTMDPEPHTDGVIQGRKVLVPYRLHRDGLIETTPYCTSWDPSQWERVGKYGNWEDRTQT